MSQRIALDSTPAGLPPALDHYQPLHRLAQQARSATWFALERATGRSVVLKSAQDADAAALNHAFEVLRAAECPFLPEPLELVRDGQGQWWLVTAWVEGRPLQGAAPSTEALVSEVRALATALQVIHQLGWHHGDLSPANVVLTPNGYPVLVDFGLCGQMGVGTPGFLAPEALHGVQGAAADVFALGSLLAWRWSGRPALRDVQELVEYRGPSPSWLESRVFAGQSAPASWHALASGMLAVDPTQRLTAKQVLAQLEHVSGTWRTLVGTHVRRDVNWQIPTHVRYRGEAVAAVVEALASETVRVVAVVGPKQSGRHRVLHELRANGMACQLDSTVQGPATWAECCQSWLELPSQQVAGLHAQSVNDGPDTLVAGVASAAALAQAKLVFACEAQIASGLAQKLGKALHCVEIQPWDCNALGEWIAPWLEVASDANGERERWVQALHEASGGWPARVIRLLQACARHRIAQLDHAWLQQVAALGADLTVDLALQICAVAFGQTLPKATQAGDCDWVIPSAEKLTQAQRVIGDVRYAELARDAWAALRAPADATLPLLLAVDAREELERRMREWDVLGTPWPAPALTWIEGRNDLSDDVLAGYVRWRLRQGEAASVWQWSQGRVKLGGEAWVESLRAAQQLGHAREVLTALEQPNLLPTTREIVQALRWRSLIDLGRADEVLRDVDTFAAALASEAGTSPWGRAQAWLWAGYAASIVTPPRPEQAHAWWQRALAALEGREDWRAQAIVARIFQVWGNFEVQLHAPQAALQYYRHAASAYTQAGERLGFAMTQTNICAVALLVGALEQARVAGESAVRALLGRRQIQPLVGVVHNLVQVLWALGEHHLANCVIEALSLAIEGQGGAPLDRLRLAAMRLRASSLAGPQGAGDPAATFALIEALKAHRAPREAQSLAAEMAIGAYKHQDRELARLLVAWLRTEAAPATNEVLEADVATALAIWREGPADPLAIVVSQVKKWPKLAVLRRLLWGWHLADTGRAAWAREVVVELAHVQAHVAPARRKQVMEGLMAELGEVSTLSAEVLRDLAALTQAAPPLALAPDLPVPTGPANSSKASPPVQSVLGAEPALRRKEAAPLERVVRWYRRIAAEPEVAPMVERIVDALLELTQAERAFVCFRGLGRELSARREVQSGSAQFAVSTSVLEQVTSSALPLLSVDAAADGRLDRAASVSHLHLRSVLAAPLIAGGTVVGVVYVDDRLRRGAFDGDDLAVVEYFAELAALALAHALALEDLRQRGVELEMSQAQLAARLEARDREVADMREVGLQRAVQQGRYRDMIGRSPAMQAVFRLIERLAIASVPVYVSGESGTGKELVARALHDSGPRAGGPFIAENCGAIPETLLESVLFGHAKGAFTGADSARAGLFEMADGGTIFLDELGEMSLAMQAKLLRVLQESEIRRIGESRPRKINARVIAASNCDLDEMVRKGTFRRDLFYRIHVVRIDLPALRERLLDLPHLIAHLLTRHGGSHLRVKPSALRKMSTYAWPGNVRELENEILRWIALCDGEVSDVDLSPALRGEIEPQAGEATLLLRPQVDRLERTLIRRALTTCKNNQSQAAALLGLSRFGLQKKLKRLGDLGPEESENDN